MLVEIYTKPDCPHCLTTKTILNNHNIPYIEHEIGRNITREEIKARFPDAKFVPIIIVDNEKLDNVNNLQQLLLENEK